MRLPGEPFAVFVASGQPPRHRAKAVWNTSAPPPAKPALRNAPAQAVRVDHIPSLASGRIIAAPLERRDGGLRR
jgi:hypothetical protein